MFKGLTTIAALVVSASAAATRAGTIIDADFNSINTGSYAAGTTLSNGLGVTGNAGVDIIARSAGNNALAIKNGAQSADLSGVSLTFSGITSGATGDNGATLAFDIMVPTQSDNSVSSGHTYIYLGSNSNGTGAAVQGHYYRTNGAPGLAFYNPAATPAESPVALTRDVWYRVVVKANFASTTQDSYNLTITRIGEATPMTDVTINTRQPNITPTMLTITSGIPQTAMAGSPIVVIDNLSLTSHPVPEVASLSVLGVGAAGMLLRTRQ